MAKITLGTIASASSDYVLINTNFQEIADHLNDLVLYRDNPVGEANQTSDNVDLNSNDILNAGTVNTDTLVVDGVNLNTQIAAAAASAAAALVSENNAAASETAASSSAGTAAADAILTAADVVLTAADAVSTAADVVSTNADAVSTTASAAAALVSENAAALSETNAATSESNASTSETNAGTSETNAGTSETNAGVSETNAAASAVSAAASADAIGGNVFEASAIGDYLGYAMNINNTISDRVTFLPTPYTAQPTGITVAGSFNICDELGSTIASPTTVTLESNSFTGVVAIKFGGISLFSTDVIHTIRAASADASITFTYS
jgi:hypothetical protein